MTGGLIQLVAYGIQDIFLTTEPQITFFKIVYRRHTNFSIESIRQNFINTPDFGKRSTCLVATNGDLIYKSYLVVKLPTIEPFANDNITKMAWVRKVGYAIIRTVDIEIGGVLIDRHYGEWLNIWCELTINNKLNGYNEMIGNVSELLDYSNGKSSHTLYVPLQFWFCRSSSMALPITALQYNEIKINIELQDFNKCAIIAPSHYIELETEFANFPPFEYIEQNVDGVIAAGQFIYYDTLSKRLYYNAITTNKFKSIAVNESALSIEERIAYATNTNYKKYWIIGASSNRFCLPRLNSTSVVHSYTRLRDVHLEDCYMLIDYIYLDREERKKFIENRHDYLIEQLIQIDEQIIEGPNRKLNLNLIQPSKLLTWVIQYDNFNVNNDFFNYTDNYKYINNKLVGKSLIYNQTLQFNSRDRLSLRQFNYFGYLQPYQYFDYAPSEGINVYSFSMFPEEVTPSGTCNMSQIDKVDLQVQLNTNISISNQARFRAYSLGYNILRIINGISGIVFTR
jgi:hypothetical protein